MENYIFDRQECLDCVEKNEGDSLNFSELAVRFNLRHKNGNLPKNGGQILKQFLIESDCNLERFDNKNTLRIRKRKRRYLYVNKGIINYGIINFFTFHYFTNLA